MDWTAQVDGYCERTDFTIWAEPLNAATNLAFLAAAAVMWWRVRGQGMPLAVLLAALLAAIGIGSGLFHTFATRWAGLADVLPIGLFILAYVYAANRHYWGWPVWGAALGTAAFVPYAAATIPLFQALPFFGISAAYWPVPVLIFAYAALLRRRAPQTARGLAIGAGILCLSLVLRSLDQPLCATIPIGTHLWWHLLNGAMLGWMIEVYRRHMVAARGGVQ